MRTRMGLSPVAVGIAGLAEVVVAQSRPDPTRAPTGWRVVHEARDEGSPETFALVSGLDSIPPVTARVRLVARPGPVRLAAKVACVKASERLSGRAWWRTIACRGRAIVRVLPLAPALTGRGQISNPESCHWVVGARGGGGVLRLVLEVGR